MSCWLFKAATKQKMPHHIQVQYVYLRVSKSRQAMPLQYCDQKLDLCMTRTAKHTLTLEIPTQNRFQLIITKQDLFPPHPVNLSC